MPHFKCTKCHHEWDDIKKETNICDWCGAQSNILEEQTPFELFIKDTLEKQKGKK